MDYKDFMVELSEKTNALAEELHTIVAAMPGRGIYPADSPAVEAKLKEIERKLRMLGANPRNPIPF